jgi:hypothetical protein
MTEVVVPAALLPKLPLPPVCARTGRPAERTRAVRATHTPKAAYALLLFGVIGVVAALFMGTRCTFRLPAARGLAARRAAAATAAWVCGAVALVAGVMALVTPTPARLVTFALAAATAATTAHLARDAWVVVRMPDEVTVRLRGLHPAFAQPFAAAVAQAQEAERRRALAGWHPDPAGHGGLRWFDGAAWTEHVAPAPPVAAW